MGSGWKPGDRCSRLTTGVKSGKVNNPMRSKQFLASFTLFSFLFSQLAALADDKKAPNPVQQRETVAKPMTDKQKKRQEDKLRKELERSEERRVGKEGGSG